MGLRSFLFVQVYQNIEIYYVYGTPKTMKMWLVLETDGQLKSLDIYEFDTYSKEEEFVIALPVI